MGGATRDSGQHVSHDTPAAPTANQSRSVWQRLPGLVWGKGAKVDELEPPGMRRKRRKHLLEVLANPELASVASQVFSARCSAGSDCIAFEECREAFRAVYSHFRLLDADITECSFENCSVAGTGIDRSLTFNEFLELLRDRLQRT